MSPSQQNGWLLRIQDTLCVTYKVNKHLSKKMKTNIYVKINLYEINLYEINLFEIYGWIFFQTSDFSQLPGKLPV